MPVLLPLLCMINLCFIMCYSWKITTTDPLSFIWAFQKDYLTDQDNAYAHPTYKMKDDRAVMYDLEVTNTLQGGATSCKSCPVGTNQAG